MKAWDSVGLGVSGTDLWPQEQSLLGLLRPTYWSQILKALLSALRSSRSGLDGMPSSGKDDELPWARGSSLNPPHPRWPWRGFRL